MNTIIYAAYQLTNEHIRRYVHMLLIIQTRITERSQTAIRPTGLLIQSLRRYVRSLRSVGCVNYVR